MTTTTLPGWVRNPQPGTGSVDLAVPTELVQRLNELADRLAVGPETLMITAHAKVLAALTGQSGVEFGQLCDGRLLTRRMPVDPGSWRDLIMATRPNRVETGDHHPPTASVVQIGAADVDPTGSAMIVVGFGPADGRLRIRVGYRRASHSSAAAARIAGYHRTALELMITDVDADHDARSLLSAAELRDQLQSIVGPDRELPAVGFHRLFEQRVRSHPDRIAAEHLGERLSYGQLNARANRIARSLIDRGLRAEEPVAVITERNLSWLIAVIAVLKAGGAYLPVEPNFPPPRIEAMLRRADCRLVLDEAAVLNGTADPGGDRSDADRSEGDCSDADLDVETGPGRLAYIFFTSGSTGEPKGAMCEQAGMINHLLAKIDDLGLTEDTVLAQTAPQCFDISLWQLLSALLVGGRTLIVDQEAILDVPRFTRTISAGRVTALQLVPSYLDAVLSSLQRDPVDLAALRCVSVTGEALPRRLAERWFATLPGVPMINAYGLTETSDDTNHEILHAAPEDDTVPVGRLLPNVRAYLLDARSRPVPLGATGEIVFSGVCVGRGYIGDPERTRLAFGPDPYRPGERIYRSGDLGRWLPDGRLLFLGRRDAQVKISGFRIEIGEVEARLRRLPGVQQAAVVVADRESGNPRLVGYYTGAATEAEVRSGLQQALPAYMVPGSFRSVGELPLTGNGKIDRKALSAPRATTLPPSDPPRTPAERRLAAAWSAVLGTDAALLTRNDHFFDSGGTSLAAVKLAIALDRAVTIKDISTRPVLSDLARLLATTERTRP